MLVETAAMGTASPDSPTIINLTIPVFIFASITVAIVGLMVGAVELIFVERLFSRRSFLSKILYKFLLYTLMMLVIISIAYPIAASFESQISIFDQQVWQKFMNYLFSITFLSTLLQMATSIMLCLIYAAISENLGHNVLLNFFTGKYHKPRVEERIFMFLDMKSSTSHAEKLGHTTYFKLLGEYYNDLSDAIINHLGEVYQYIGDEVVISWKYKVGLSDNNCINCFFAMKNALSKRSNYYQSHYGIVPSFKAGMHLGEVATGEIGALRKDIFFTGDVLNATSRIQSLCNHYQADFLISEKIYAQLYHKENLTFRSVGETSLKGKAESMVLYTVERASET